MQAPAHDEVGTIIKSWRGRKRVVLVYPNRYSIGITNLGFQTVYRLLNQIDEVVCERAFLPPPAVAAKRGVRSVESQRALADFDIIAFSISFENDYPHVLKILDQAGLPLRWVRRDETFPLVIAGGVACGLNPEPLAPFVDCFFIGEAEAHLVDFMAQFDAGHDRESLLLDSAGSLKGVYAPRFYQPDYDSQGLLTGFAPNAGLADRVQKVYPSDLTQIDTHSAITTPLSVFDAPFLVEIGRGCPRGCRFCTAGFIYRPPRFRPAQKVVSCVLQAGRTADKIGLVGAAIADHPEIDDICRQLLENGVKMAFSSLRADALTPQLIKSLRQSGVQTATIAPDAGSERLRRVINKGLEEEQILEAARVLVSEGIPNLKLYFMVGLPTETMQDVEAIVMLCKRIKHGFLATSRTRDHMGTISVSLNCFVPKPFTPFQWAAMDTVAALKRKLKHVRGGLARVANVQVHTDVPRWARIQALLARGDRRVADLLELNLKRDGNWPQTFKEAPLNADFFVHRERPATERFPWDFIDHGIKKSYLYREYQKALTGELSAVCEVDTCRRCGVCV
jgi:radical SAM superfamily enzyme YgiQ (UPF0313 family)